MNVKRYEFVASNSCECVFPNIIEESSDGDLVSYSDYLALVARLKDAEEEIDNHETSCFSLGAVPCVYRQKYPDPVKE